MVTFDTCNELHARFYSSLKKEEEKYIYYHFGFLILFTLTNKYSNLATGRHSTTSHKPLSIHFMSNMEKQRTWNNLDLVY